MLGGSRFLRLRLLSLLSLTDNGGSSILLKTSVGHLATIKRWDDSHVAIGDRKREVHTGKSRMLGTTVLCVRKNESVVIIGDGQVTLGSEIVKPNVKKVRRIRENVIGGFAGATADAFTLFERLENQLEEHSGELIRAAVELAKAWRTDKFLRRLDAVMVVANSDISLSITGNGDVLEPHDGIIAIGSGGPYAVAAARALIDIPNMDAETIARKAMKIAADSCIYTNHNFTIEIISSLQSKQQDSEQDSKAAIVSAPDIQDMLNANSIPSTSTTTNDKSSSPADSLEMPLNNQGIHMSI